MLALSSLFSDFLKNHAEILATEFLNSICTPNTGQRENPSPVERNMENLDNIPAENNVAQVFGDNGKISTKENIDSVEHIIVPSSFAQVPKNQERSTYRQVLAPTTKEAAVADSVNMRRKEKENLCP